MRTVSLLVTCLIANAAPAQGDHLYTVTTLDGFLRRVNPLTGATSSSVQMVTTAGPIVQKGNGLALHPLTGQLFAIVRDASAPNARKLAIVDPLTGATTVVGTLADAFASLAFRADGVLFGVTGDGATVAETLYTIDVGTAQATFALTLGNGNDGEAIAFGTDGFLYHSSGLGVPNIHEIFERIDTNTNLITPIALSGFDHDEVLSITAFVGGNLLVADRFDNLIVLSTTGAASRLGTFDHVSVKGLAFLPSPNTQPFFHLYGGGCFAAAGTIPLLAGTGTPRPGQFVQMDLLLAPANSAALFAVGFGNQSLPIPSPSCQLQIAPLSTVLLPITTSPTGTWTIGALLPPGPPLDLFVQIVVLDGQNLILSNPLQMHIL